jgi:hypothetical protein
VAQAYKGRKTCSKNLFICATVSLAELAFANSVGYQISHEKSRARRAKGSRAMRYKMQKKNAKHISRAAKSAFGPCKIRVKCDFALKIDKNLFSIIFLLLLDYTLRVCFNIGISF